MAVIQKHSQPSNNAPGGVFHLACFGESGPTVADSKHRHQPWDVSLGKTMRTPLWALANEGCDAEHECSHCCGAALGRCKQR